MCAKYIVYVPFVLFEHINTNKKTKLWSCNSYVTKHTYSQNTCLVTNKICLVTINKQSMYVLYCINIPTLTDTNNRLYVT